MPSRRKFLEMTTGAAIGLAVGGCNSVEPVAAPTYGPSRDRELDLTDLTSNEPRPPLANEAAQAAVRIWAQDPAKKINILTSGVRTKRNTVLGSAAFRKTIDGQILKQRLRIQMAIDAGGRLVVRDALRGAVPDNAEAALFEMDKSYSGRIATEWAQLSDMQPGMVLHHVGYQAANPIDERAPQVGFRLAFLSGFLGSFSAVVRPPEGGAPAFTSSSLGGPIITPTGELLGVAVAVQPATVRDLLDDKFGAFDRVVTFNREINDEVDVPPKTEIQIVTGRAIDSDLFEHLYGRLETIPSPGR